MYQSPRHRIQDHLKAYRSYFVELALQVESNQNLYLNHLPDLEQALVHLVKTAALSQKTHKL